MSKRSSLERVLEWLVGSEDANRLALRYYGPPLERAGGRTPFESGDEVHFGASGSRSSSYTLSSVLDYAWQSIRNIFQQSDRKDAKGRAYPAQPGYNFWINYAYFCKLMHDRGTPVIDPLTGKEQYWEDYTDNMGNYWAAWQQARAQYEQETLDDDEAYLSDFLQHIEPPNLAAAKPTANNGQEDGFISASAEQLQALIQCLPPDKAAQVLAILSNDTKPAPRKETRLSRMVRDYMQEQGLKNAKELASDLLGAWRITESSPAFAPSVDLLETVLQGEELSQNHPAYIQVVGCLASVLRDSSGQLFEGDVTRFLKYIEADSDGVKRSV